MMRFTKALLYSTVLCGALILPGLVFAQEVSGFSRLLGVVYPDTRLLVLRIMQIIWFFTTLGSIGFVIYGYILYRQADPEDLEEEPQAKRTMFYGGIAAGVSILLLIIVSIAFAVIEGGYTRQAPGGVGEKPYVPTLGGQAIIQTTSIRDHHPLNDEKNVPRDTFILITFAEKIKKESVLDAQNTIKSDAIIIRRTSASSTGNYGVVRATGFLSADGITLKIVPAALLGDASAKVSYSVLLTSALKKENDTPFFSKDSGYSWQFEISGLIDNTPPTVESYLPIANSKNPINSIIQVTFSEPVDPFTANLQNLIVETTVGTASVPILGTWTVGNGYRTATFVSSAACGTNQCGDSVFCLPQLGSVSVRLKAAGLQIPAASQASPNKAQFPYGGIVDMTGNSLDGGGKQGTQKNAKSEGSPLDDFYWSFATGTQKELTPPTLVSIQPGRDGVGISLTAPVDVTFSHFMDVTSLNVSTLGFTQSLNYWISGIHNFAEQRTHALVNHEAFKADTIYTPVVKSPVTDIYQNCFNPCTGPGVAAPAKNP